MESVGKIVGGILLVAGTTIGAAILALPVTTGLLGFYPTIGLFFIYWILMTFAGLLFLEVNLWFDHDGINIISMSKGTLGTWGESVSWVLYLALLYLLTTAYMAVSGPFFLEAITHATGWAPPEWFGPIPLILIFSFFVYEGASYVDYLNRLLMIGLVVTYFMLSAWLIPHVDTELLGHVDFRFLPLAIALVATSFGYHIIIPSLTTYLHRDVSALVKVILIGGTIPFLVNGFWIFVSLGTLPLQGEFGLMHGYVDGQSAVHLLSGYLGHPWLVLVGRLFVFFAIVTSFLGVSLSLRDFLSDGFGIERDSGYGRWSLYFLTFVPPLFFTLTVERAFFKALDYAGVLGVLVLLVIMPILMTWSGRYKKGFSSSRFKTPGGKLALIVALILTVAMIGLDVATKSGVFDYKELLSV